MSKKKDKLPKIFKTLSFKTPGFDLFVGINCSFKEYIEKFDSILEKSGNEKISIYLSKEEIETNKCGKELFFIDKIKGGYRCGLYLCKFDYNIALRGVLNHEVRHLVDDISDHLGFMQEREFTAYLTETITEEIEKVFRDRYNKLNNV